MWRRGRSAVQDFGAHEDLYYRFPPAQISHGSVVIPVGSHAPFRFPAFSVNWSRFSEPEWVLIRPSSHPDMFYDGFRAGAIRVGGLPVDYHGFALRPVQRSGRGQLLAFRCA